MQSGKNSFLQLPIYNDFSCFSYRCNIQWLHKIRIDIQVFAAVMVCTWRRHTFHDSNCHFCPGVTSTMNEQDYATYCDTWHWIIASRNSRLELAEHLRKHCYNADVMNDMALQTIQFSEHKCPHVEYKQVKYIHSSHDMSLVMLIY